MTSNPNTTKQILVYLDNGILFSNKMKQTTDT